jgi:hypothetical protein
MSEKTSYATTSTGLGYRVTYSREHGNLKLYFMAPGSHSETLICLNCLSPADVSDLGDLIAASINTTKRSKRK